MSWTCPRCGRYREDCECNGDSYTLDEIRDTLMERLPSEEDRRRAEIWQAAMLISVHLVPADCTKSAAAMHREEAVRKAIALHTEFERQLGEKR